MKLDFSLAYLVAHKLQQEITGLVKKRTVRKATIGSLLYSNDELNETEDFVPSNFTVVQQDTYVGLSPRAALLVNRMISELKENNSLWQFDQTLNKREQKAISELRRTGILFKTEVTTIHFVNPLFIRRGTPAGVLFNMIHLLQATSRVTPEMIRNLKARKHGFVNPVEREEMHATVV